MKTSLKLLAPAMALPLALGFAAPAAAGPNNGWSEHRQATYYDNRRDRRNYNRGNRYSHRGIERRIEALARDMRQARRSGELTRYEARIVRSRISTVRRAYSAFARNGLSRRDVRTINWRIDQAYDALNRASYNRHARNDRRGNGQGRYRQRH